MTEDQRTAAARTQYEQRHQEYLGLLAVPGGQRTAQQKRRIRALARQLTSPVPPTQQEAR